MRPVSCSFKSLGQSDVIRDQLTASSLLQGRVTQLVSNHYYMPIGEEQMSPHKLSGTLHFSETMMTTMHANTDWRGSGQNLFPAFSLRVLHHEGHLIPLDRGIIYSGEKLSSFHNIIVFPGRVWREPTDNGYSRASFPFTLTSNVLGETWNGVATFVFNDLELLNRNKVREALYKTSNRGLVAGRISRYLQSVWLFPMENEGCQIDVPYMAGWGGNYVAMIPSGISVFRFADVHSPVLSSMVRVAERYNSSCQ